MMYRKPYLQPILTLHARYFVLDTRDLGLNSTGIKSLAACWNFSEDISNYSVSTSKRCCAAQAVQSAGEMGRKLEENRVKHSPAASKRTAFIFITHRSWQFSAMRQISHPSTSWHPSATVHIASPFIPLSTALGAAGILSTQQI